MTREQIEVILKASNAKQGQDGWTLPEGSNVTFHVSHDGGSLAFGKLESLRFDGELLFGKSAKGSVAFVASDVVAVATEGTTGTPRRPAGF